jgi:hypothetical protein
VTVQRGKRRIVVTATLDDAATSATTAPATDGMAPVALAVKAPG